MNRTNTFDHLNDMSDVSEVIIVLKLRFILS